jgi:hypothetical protein
MLKLPTFKVIAGGDARVEDFLLDLQQHIAQLPLAVFQHLL